MRVPPADTRSALYRWWRSRVGHMSVPPAAILTQPDVEGRQHPVAYENRKLTAAERNYPAHVLELLAVTVIHELRAYPHYLLGGGEARPEGCWTDFDMRTDNQAIMWLEPVTNWHLNKMCIRLLDEIEDVTHLPGSRNPTVPLSPHGFADGDDPAATTGSPTRRASRSSSRVSAATPPTLSKGGAAPRRRCSPPSERLGGHWQAPGALRERRLPAPRGGTHFHVRSRGGRR